MSFFAEAGALRVSVRVCVRVGEMKKRLPSLVQNVVLGVGLLESIRHHSPVVLCDFHLRHLDDTVFVLDLRVNQPETHKITKQ